MLMSSNQSLEPHRWTRPRNKLTKEVLWAEFAPTPSFATGVVRHRGAKAKGLRYEASVISRLTKEVDDNFWTVFDKCWLRYGVSGEKSEICQPDVFLLNHVTGRILLVEVKLSRTAQAWYQLQKYEAVLQKMFPRFDIAKLEIASNVYAVDVPEKVRVVTDIYAARTGCTSFMKMSYKE